MTDLIKLYELLKEKIGEETAKLLVDTISKIYSNGYIKNEQFIEVIRKLDEFARREDLDKLSNYIIELSRAIEGRIKSFEDMVKFEFSNIWQELKQLSGKIEEIQKNFATKDDIKRIEERIEKIEEEQKNFATKDDIKRIEERIEKIEANQENFATKDDIRELKEEQKNFATKDDIRELKEEQKNFATKDDIKELKEEQKNFATKDDIKRLEKRIERLEKMILGFSITIISSILLYFLSRIFLP